MKKPAFSIGDWVTATHVVELAYETDEPEQPIDYSQNGFLDDRRLYSRRVKRVEQRVVGQIVGGTFRPLGDYRHGSGPYNEDGDYSPPYLSVKSTVFLYLIREGFTNSPKECLLEDLSRIEPPKKGMPMRKVNQPLCGADTRKFLSECAKDQPRVNGKFVKVK